MAVVAVVALVLVSGGELLGQEDETLNPSPSSGQALQRSTSNVQQSEPGGEPKGEPNLIRRAPRNESSRPASSDEGLTVGQVVLALGIVLSLILVLRWAAVRLMAGRGGSGSAGAVEVLSRTVVSPRQYLMLVRVGRRLVVVANSGAQMNAVCEISDPGEVAELIGRVEEEKGGSVSAAFSSLFTREKQEYEADGVVPPGEAEASDPDLSETREELSGLMEKVRMVSRQFRRV